MERKKESLWDSNFSGYRLLIQNILLTSNLASYFLKKNSF